MIMFNVLEVSFEFCYTVEKERWIQGDEKMIYYVSVNGNDLSAGTKEAPFRTINRAAKIAAAGDTVRVHGGIYRECVDPQNGGVNDGCRIVYEAVDGELPIIKGSEIVTDWEKVEGTVWKKTLPNTIFGDFNPFAIPIFGDWFSDPFDYEVHLGDVYLNGVSMYEAPDYEALCKAEKRLKGACHHSRHLVCDEKIRYPEHTVYQWFARVGAEETELFCNFQEYDPNRETIEISVRESCFFPKRTGINYITVRGFEMAHAATQWAPPTAEQIGMIGPHWSRGWIIENNHFHDAKCSAISLGKEITTGHNLHSRFLRKSGYQYQQEAVFLALRQGWRKENIGSHIVRNNRIHDCGQTGIVGHMGGAFSRIEHNHIYNINKKQEFWGHEVAGIKLHAAVDTVIENNNIHNCNLGIWLDWQAQGTRVTKNLFYENDRDLMIEVTHGPCLLDNNVFLSPVAIQNAAQGTAYVHNLICGLVCGYNVLDRATPYHYPHTTDVAGYAFVYGGDDRVMNNIIIGKEPSTETLDYFGRALDQYSIPEEYMPALRKIGIRNDHYKYYEVAQPVWVEENAYSGYAKPFRAEVGPIMAEGMRAFVEEKDGEWLLTIEAPSSLVETACKAVTTGRLGAPRLTEELFENPDGSPIDLTIDIVGNVRSEHILPGAFAHLNPGVNTISVWREEKN